MMFRRALIAVGAAWVCMVTAGSARATFPGANGRIAFHYSNNAQSLVATMNPDGSSVRFLGAGGQPSWSSNGHRIAFIRSVPNESDIYTMRADGSNVRRLTFTPHTNEISPAFSPSGGRIVFWTADYPPPARHFSVVSIRSDGSHRRVLARRGAQPDWAPNGKHIVYEGAGIEIMRPDGTHKQPIYAPSNFSTASPHYEATGRSIVFARCRIDPETNGGCGPTQWMRMGAFGGNLHRLPISSDVFNVQPSPAGGCYVGWTWRKYGDGSEVRNIRTSGLGCPVAGWLTDYRQRSQAATSPSWQPLP